MLGPIPHITNIEAKNIILYLRHHNPNILCDERTDGSPIRMAVMNDVVQKEKRFLVSSWHVFLFHNIQ